MPRRPNEAKPRPPLELDAKALAQAKVDSVEEGDSTEPKVKNWAEDVDSEAYAKAAKLYPKIQRCYDNKQDQADQIEEFWNIFNAQPDANQSYIGNSQCYVPVVRDAIKARFKRCLAQIFPPNRHHVGAIGPTRETPYAQISLLEHYIRKCGLKDTVRQDLIAGDVTGQWNLYIDWSKSYRQVTEAIRRNPIVETTPMEAQGHGIELEDVTAEPEEQDEQLVDKTVIEEGPDIVAFPTEDLAVYPPTVNDIERAEASAIRLRMSKDKVQQMIDEGVFVGKTADELVDKMAKPQGRLNRNPAKQRVSDAGIKTEGTLTFALIYEVHTNLQLDGDREEAAFVYYAGPNEILGIVKNPFWSGKRPILSKPTEKMTGSFFGKSSVDPVKFMQWNLNDYWNMGQDSAQYALLPIVMTDPTKQPNWQSMVMGLAAVWLADPNSTKFATFPALWKDSMVLCDQIKRQIWESMDVNEIMMGRAPAGRKNNQLLAALQQDTMTNIIDHARRYEEEMLEPLLEWIFELDRQFRTKSLMVRTVGEIGMKAQMTEIGPQQFGETYFFTWEGTSYVAGMQRIQQMVAWANVLRGIPPQLLGGKRLDLSPIAEAGTLQIFGADVAPRILVDEQSHFTIDPNDENLMMHNNLPVEVHPADQDPQHIQAHLAYAESSGDPNGRARAHIAKHVMQLQAKRMQQAGAMQPAKGLPGAPGAGGASGAAGTPRIGAQPGAPRPQGPPGQVHPDQILDAGVPGRG